MIKVKWLKAHPRFAYSQGDIGYVTPQWAETLLSKGCIIIIPEAEEYKPEPNVEKVNPLPDDLPGRDKLFITGYKNAEEIKKVAEVNEGDGLLDAGISVSMLKKIRRYFKIK